MDMRIVIMGGTAGIGLATVRLLAAEGSEVIVTGRDPQRLTAAGNGAAAAKGGEAGGGLVAEQCRLSGTGRAEPATTGRTSSRVRCRCCARCARA